VCVCVQQIQQTSLQPRLVQKKLQKAVKPMNIIVLLACRSVSPSFLLLSNFYSSLKTLESRFFFFKTQIPCFGSNSQTTRKQVRAQHHKKIRQRTQFLTISSTNSISYNFFNPLNVTKFLHNTISLTNSKAQFYTFFKKFETWISSMCIFHLQMC
jgi:hypothetical protein